MASDKHNSARDNSSSLPGGDASGDFDAEAALTTASWLVFALVVERPSYGYELYRRYDERFGSFLRMTRPRVYRTLERLENTRMIEKISLDPSEARGKQERLRRTYRATGSGVKAYRHWVADRIRDDPQRVALLGRIASTGLLGIDAIGAVIDRYASECMEELGELRKLPAFDPKESENIGRVAEALVLDHQRRELRAHIDWATHARQMLKHIESDPGALGRYFRDVGKP